MEGDPALKMVLVKELVVAKQPIDVPDVVRLIMGTPVGLGIMSVLSNAGTIPSNRLILGHHFNPCVDSSTKKETYARESP